MLTVAKFGGSSLSSRQQFEKVKTIINSDLNRRVVVVSAIGRKEKSDDKVTDLLYLISAHIEHRVSYEELWENFSQRFRDLKSELGLTYDIELALQELRAEIESENLPEDYLVSRGENFTANLMADYLSFEFVDAAEVIIFNSQGEIDLEASGHHLLERLDPTKKYVIPGFYGAYENGTIRLMSRGGSDITGAILSSCLQANKYENWTDVSGVLKADPSIVENPMSTAELTYDELSELSYMGASVLHEETIYPIRALDIPLFIKNTNAPNDEGSVILRQHKKTPDLIAGISGKKNYLSINIIKGQMSSEKGFLQKTLKIFQDYSINIEHIPTGINQVGIILEAKEVENKLLSLLESLQEELKPEELTVREQISLLSIVGEVLIKDSHLTERIFSALARKNIEIEMIAQSPRSLNIILGVQDQFYQEAIRVIYDELVSKSL